MAKKTPGSDSGRFRNPPEHTRFRKGHSGNPRGRPRGSKNLRTLIEQELDQQLEISENGKTMRLTKRKLMVKKLVNEAASGNPRAWRELLPLINGTSEAETVELDETTSAMIASYLARYHRSPASAGGEAEGHAQADPQDERDDGESDGEAADDEEDGR